MDKKDLKKEIINFILFVIGVFFIALNYNMFLLPNNLVVGGVSGLAIIFEKIFAIDSVLFIYFVNGLLLLISFIFLGVKKTSRSIVGSILYPVFISLTTPLVSEINFVFSNELVMYLLSAIILGVGTAFVYKGGYTTGGSDIIIQIVGDKGKKSSGNSMIIVNAIIIFAGGFIFGYEKVIYAFLILFINSMIVDRILLGISDSKMFYIYTTKIKKVKKLIFEEIKTGATVLDIEGGYTKEKSQMLMCVVRTRDYFLFKEKILEIDPHAFIVIHDCYEVMGGVKRRNLPFISN